MAEEGQNEELGGLGQNAGAGIEDEQIIALMERYTLSQAAYQLGVTEKNFDAIRKSSMNLRVRGKWPAVKSTRVSEDIPEVEIEFRHGDEHFFYSFKVPWTIGELMNAVENKWNLNREQIRFRYVYKNELNHLGHDIDDRELRGHLRVLTILVMTLTTEN